MLFICCDIETDGPAPSRFSMVELGAVVVQYDHTQAMWVTGPEFVRRMRPVTSESDPGALQAIGYTRAELEAFPHDAYVVMQDFNLWAGTVREGVSTPRFVADNAGFDWMFVCDYFWRYVGGNPFGFSCLSLTSFYQGIVRNLDRRKGSFKHLRQTRHTHNALDDARGNAEALCSILNNRVLNIQFR